VTTQLEAISCPVCTTAQHKATPVVATQLHASEHTRMLSSGPALSA